MQGDFIKILAEEKENVTWQSIAYNVPKGILSFALKASTNCLNTPDNLKRWGMKQLANCALCKNYCTLLHILNYCKVSLVQGRFTSRHNSVFCPETCEICNFRNMGRHSRTHIKWEHSATRHTLHCPKTRCCHCRKRIKTNSTIGTHMQF